MKKIRKIKWIITLSMSAFVFSNCQSSQNNNLETDKPMIEKSIYKAIESNDLKAIERLLTLDINLEQKNSDGQTPLLFATYLQRNEIALELMKAGANVNAQDKILNSPFLYAGAEGNLEIVKEALKHGANFNVFNRYGGTALIPAAEKGHLEMVRLLVNTPGFPIDHVNRLGWTAIMEAVVLSDGGPVHIEIVKSLIEGGVDVNIPDSKGVTALKHAKTRGFKEIVSLLENAGAH